MGDRETTEYRRRVYALVQSIPYGKATSYGAVADAVGGSPRSVGTAMKHCNFDDVPAHRVCAADRRLGGYGGKARTGWNRGPAAELKRRRLLDEGVTFDECGRIDEDHFLYDLTEEEFHLPQTPVDRPIVHIATESPRVKRARVANS